MKNLLLLFFFLISANSFSQEIKCDNPKITEAYRLAVKTVDANTHQGLLAAGGDYGGEWVRDIAINSWNGVSLLRPQVAEQSLWSVTLNKDTIGHQYWDRIIWVTAAYNHYLATGDRAFLKQAYTCSVNTIGQLEKLAFDNKYGLFMGPSVFNDGIAGYPEPIYEPGNFSSYVLDHKNSHRIKCLSTNCIYYSAYVSLGKMGQLLGESKMKIKVWQQKALTLKGNILKHLYDSRNNTFNYLVDHTGKVDKSQEGLGLSFAVMFGIVQGEKARQMIARAVVSPYGITSICPDFPRYSAEKPGRHNNLIWPMVNGYFAQAAIDANNGKSFALELNGLTQLALDADKGNGDFKEIYNPLTGIPDGGYQAAGKDDPDHHWASCKAQTWSATAYMNMVQYGLAGIRLENNGITFKPFLPENVHFLELKDIPYRQAKLNITIQGQGGKIKTFTLNGKKQASSFIGSALKGTNEIAIELE